MSQLAEVGVGEEAADGLLRAEGSAVLNLANAVFCRAQTHPDSIALVIDEAKYSYAQLAEAAARVAAWVRRHARHRAEGPRVGILAARSIETYAGILGAAWAGGTYVPLNPKQPAARLATIFPRAGLDALIVDKKGAAHLAELGEKAPAAVLSDLNIDLEPMAAPAAVTPEHAAYIMFTSGTTGVPKGVVVTCGNVAHFIAVSRSLYHVNPADRLGQFCETSFDVSVFEMFAAWDGGAELHIVPEGQLMAPGGFIRKHAITIWTSVPSVIMTMQRFKQLEPDSMPSLRAAYFIGEALPAASAKAWQAAAPKCVIDNEYGPTEATVACIVYRINGEIAETEGRGTVAIGHAYPGMQGAIVSQEGKFVGANDIGELALHGTQVAAGYLDDPEQTARRFPTLDHPELGRSRWYLTGDYAFVDSEGLFHCLGRMDNQVKIMGHRVELEDVDAHVRAVCRTDEVASVAWPIVNGLAAGIVCFVAGGALGPGAIREEVRKRVPPYMVPGKVVIVPSLPLSANGKVDRKALRATLEEKQA